MMEQLHFFIKTLSNIAKKNINVDIILQSIGRDGTKDISFTVPEEDGEDAVKAIEEDEKMLNRVVHFLNTLEIHKFIVRQ